MENVSEEVEEKTNSWIEKVRAAEDVEEDLLPVFQEVEDYYAENEDDLTKEEKFCVWVCSFASVEDREIRLRIFEKETAIGEYGEIGDLFVDVFELLSDKRDQFLEEFVREDDQDED